MLVPNMPHTSPDTTPIVKLEELLFPLTTQVKAGFEAGKLAGYPCDVSCHRPPTMYKLRGDVTLQLYERGRGH